MVESEDKTKTIKNSLTINSFLSKPKTNLNNNSKMNRDESNWTKMLLYFFTTINKLDNSIEKIRSKLNLIQNFSSSNLFNYLDMKSKKFLALKDFEAFLVQNGVTYTEKNLRKFIHNFDKDNDFSLNYKEFLRIITPTKEIMPPNRDGPTEVEVDDREKLITDEIKRVFIELLKEELSFVEKSYEISEKIRNCKEFTTYEAFREIVGEGLYINVNNLGEYLKDKQISMDEGEISQLMFRIDSDDDGMISYEEFKDIFFPLNDKDYKSNENKGYLMNDVNGGKIYKFRNNFKLDLPTTINNKTKNTYRNFSTNLNDNKENNRNQNNIKLRNNNYNTYIGDSKTTKNKNKFKFETEDILNISSSVYDKNGDKNPINNQGLIHLKDPMTNNKNVFPLDMITNNYSNYNGSNILEQTKSVLNLLKKDNSKQTKNVMEDNSHLMKSPIRTKKNQEIFRNKGEKFLDTYLNYDYSRLTNNDKNNGEYYYRSKNQNQNTPLEEIKLNKYEPKKNSYNNEANTYYIRNDKIQNSPKNNNLNYNNKIINNDYNGYEEGKMMNEKINHMNNQFDYYKVNNNNNYNKYISNNMPLKKAKPIQTKLNINSQRRNNSYIINNKYNISNIEQQDLDSLESSDAGGSNNPSSKIGKKSKNKYHYNSNLTNLTRNIQDQFYYKKKGNKNKTDAHNNSAIIVPYDNKENNSNNIYKTYFEKEQKNEKQNISDILSYKENIIEKFNKNKKNKIDPAIEYGESRCPKCKCVKCFDIKLEPPAEQNSNYENYYKLDYNNSLNNKYLLGQNSSLQRPKFKKANTTLNLKYNNPKNVQAYYLESSYEDNNAILNNVISKKLNNNNAIRKNLDLDFTKKNSNNNNKYDPLCDLLLDFIKQDNIIESIRQSLSIREDVNLKDIYELFDKSEIGYISSGDIIQTFNEFGLLLNRDEIRFLFRKFNKNLKDFFYFEEFCELILPKKYSNAKIMGERYKSEYYNGIADETKKIICSLFKNIIDGEKSNENYRELIGLNKEYTGYDLFNKIKKSYSIGIYKEDIANFMKKNRRTLSNGEIELLMERFDKNKDGMVDYKEFLNEISPLEK